jgi:uncharacterized protein (DUF488 family)
MSALVLSTIGYERATLDQVIERLRTASVEIVIDVRAIAGSRRAGFSKTVLSASLAEAGIGYRHLRGLGTPKPGRQAARAGHTAQMHAIYHEHLKTPEALLALEEASEIASGQRAALLCLEADVRQCHRAIVADLIRERTGCAVMDL